MCLKTDGAALVSDSSPPDWRLGWQAPGSPSKCGRARICRPARSQHPILNTSQDVPPFHETPLCHSFSEQRKILVVRPIGKSLAVER